jgi:capsular polysaccharide biosynthesis protein
MKNPTGGPVTIQTCTAVLRTRWRLILGCTLAAGLATLVVTLAMTPTYQAEADVALVKSSVELAFDPRFKTASEKETPLSLLDHSARRKALTTIAGSPDLANAVIVTLGARLSDSERVPSKVVRAVRARSDGDLIRITARAGTAERAALLANTWAQEYAKRANSIYGDSPVTFSDVEAQAATAKRTYEEAEAGLVAYVGDNPTSQLHRAVQDKQQTLADSLTVSNKLERLLADARSLRGRLGGSGTPTGVGHELAKLILEANSFSTATNLPAQPPAGASNPSGPISLQFQIDQLKSDGTPAQQASELDALIGALAARRTLVRADDVQRLQQEVNRLQAQLEREGSKLRELTRARDLAWSTYTTLATKVAEIGVAAQARGNVVRLAVAAVAPEDPVEPRRVLYTALASLAGLVFGIAVAVSLVYANASGLKQDTPTV